MNTLVKNHKPGSVQRLLSMSLEEATQLYRLAFDKPRYRPKIYCRLSATENAYTLHRQPHPEEGYLEIEERTTRHYLHVYSDGRILAAEEDGDGFWSRTIRADRVTDYLRQIGIWKSAIVPPTPPTINERRQTSVSGQRAL